MGVKVGNQAILHNSRVLNLKNMVPKDFIACGSTAPKRLRSIYPMFCANTLS